MNIIFLASFSRESPGQESDRTREWWTSEIMATNDINTFARYQIAFGCKTEGWKGWLRPPHIQEIHT